MGGGAKAGRLVPACPDLVDAATRPYLCASHHDPDWPMRLLLAIFLPFLAFFTIGRPVAGIICLILQITLIGWIPAALWAVYALSQWNTRRQIEEARRQDLRQA